MLWAGLEPNYIDIDPNTLNMSLADLIKRIDEKTKVVIIQHTFGNPGPIDEVREICKQRNLYLFEDCAHGLGSKLNGQSLGTFGDAALISFGLEKVLSTRVGGALIMNNDYLRTVVDSTYKGYKWMSYCESIKWVINPVIWRVLRSSGVLQGPLTKLFNSLGILDQGFDRSEMYGKKPKQYPRKLSNTLASIVNEELTGLKQNLEHRKNITNKYNELLSHLEAVRSMKLHDDNIGLVRYPVILKDQGLRDQVFKQLKDDDIHVGDWYDPNIWPKGTSNKGMKYTEGSCPVAEDISKRILNLQTGKNITEEDVEYIVGRLKEHLIGN